MSESVKPFCNPHERCACHEKLKIAEEALERIAKAYIEDKEDRPTSEWSMGNYDDVFSDGITKGEHYQAEVAKNALLKLRGGAHE